MIEIIKLLFNILLAALVAEFLKTSEIYRGFLIMEHDLPHYFYNIYLTKGYRYVSNLFLFVFSLFSYYIAVVI